MNRKEFIKKYQPCVDEVAAENIAHNCVNKNDDEKTKKRKRNLAKANDLELDNATKKQNFLYFAENCLQNLFDNLDEFGNTIMYNKNFNKCAEKAGSITKFINDLSLAFGKPISYKLPDTRGFSTCSNGRKSHKQIPDFYVLEVKKHDDIR